MTHCLHSEDVPWSALGPGVEMRIVHADPKTGRASAFVHMHPGSRLISHRHIGASEFVVLEGNGAHPQADAINIGVDRSVSWGHRVGHRADLDYTNPPRVVVVTRDASPAEVGQAVEEALEAGE